jgi:riboflavin kinase / FMN adenylyltransferase
MIYFIQMQVFSGSSGVKNLAAPTVVTVGNFDGIHLGHQALINQVKERARALKKSSVVMTFDPHPMKVLFPERNLKSIFDLEDRTEIFKGLGIDALVIEPFSRELSQLEPPVFFEKLLLSNLKTGHLLVGHDFNFGKNRSGTLEVLDRLCAKHAVSLEVMAPIKIEGTVVSSTEIRRLVQCGAVDKAAKFLGRTFYLRGIVEKGAGRGHKIGFPTANLFTSAELYPKNGVYVTVAEVRGKKFRSVTNVGQNPTFVEKTRHPIQVETHILDFSEDIYGEPLKVKFLEFMRDETKFNSVDELIRQIGSDVKKAEGYNWNAVLNSSN